MRASLHVFTGKAHYPLPRRNLLHTSLEDAEILTKVSHMYSELPAPTVLVPEKNGKVRLCGHYKMTVNQSHDVDVDQHLISKPDDLLATLLTGKLFQFTGVPRKFNVIG